MMEYVHLFDDHEVLCQRFLALSNFETQVALCCSNNSFHPIDKDAYLVLYCTELLNACGFVDISDCASDSTELGQ